MKNIHTTLLFLTKNDEVLLAMKKVRFGAGWWNGIGGKGEPGESIEQALVRECQEEISVTPLSWHKAAELDFILDANTTPWHMYVHAFLVDEWQGEPCESEEMAPEWFKKDTLPYDQMWPADNEWIPLILKGDKVAGDFVFNEGNRLVSHNIKTVKLLPSLHEWRV